MADGSGTKYRVGEKSEMARVKLRLPADLTCDHCVIQVSDNYKWPLIQTRSIERRVKYGVQL